MKRLWKWYSRFAVLILTLFVLFIVLNLVLVSIYALVDSGRESEIQATQAAAEADQREKQKVVYPGWDEKEIDRLTRETFSRALNCAPFVYYIEGPGSGKYVNVNPVGFRYGSQPLPWPPDPDALTIFVFGGSGIFGYKIADSETIPAQMEVLLADQLDDRPVHVYNFGQSAYYSFQELRLFEQLLFDGYRPDIAVFIDGINEGFIQTGPENWQEPLCPVQPEPTSPLDFLLTLPINRLADSVRYRIFGQPADQVENSAPVETLPQLTPEEIVTEWKNYREVIRGIAQEFGIQPLFVWEPVPVYKYDLSYHLFRDPDIETEARTIETRAIYDIMAKEQIGDDFLFLGDIQQDKQEPLYVDSYHYTSAFSAEIAQYIVDFMLQTQIVG